MRRSRFIHAAPATYPVIVLCRVLGVARSGSYAWRRGPSARQQADHQRRAQIAIVHGARRGPSGAPRVHAPLRRPAPHLPRRDFTATAPNQRWVGDLTDLPPPEGWRSLAVRRDASSRRVVGWALADQLRPERATAALALALGRPSHAAHRPRPPLHRRRLSAAAGDAGDDRLHEPRRRLLR